MARSVNEIKFCEACDSNNLTSALDLGRHPLCADLVPLGDSRVCQKYPIEILFCQNCSTAHQRFQVAKEVLFPKSYHYRARLTADVVKGMAGLIASCIQRFGSLSGKTVLDVGCNDGTLLDLFKEVGATTIGIEPTEACLDADHGQHTLHNEFLSDDVADSIIASHGKPDFITFTNVFAHIEHLHEVLASLRRLIAPDTVTVIENHYLGAVLNGSQFDTFYHEHPRTYSYTSFVHVARALGIRVLDVEFPSRYGGNIRVFLGATAMSGECDVVDRKELAVREGLFAEGFTTLRRNMERWRTSKRRFLAEHVRKHGPIRAKAFPARAGILVNLLDVNEDSIIAVYEKPGSMKIGHYVPGTRIPIYSDDELFGLADKSVPLLNMAWHIPGEIRRYLSENGHAGPVVDIVKSEDFASAK